VPIPRQLRRGGAGPATSATELAGAVTRFGQLVADLGIIIDGESAELDVTISTVLDDVAESLTRLLGGPGPDPGKD
jgi:hypothetical protein